MKLYCMRYNQYLYWFSGQAVLITDIVKITILAANIIANPIITTSLLMSAASYHVHT